MPIIYIEGIKPHCKPFLAVPLVLLGEREILRSTTPVLWLLPLNSLTFKFNFHLFKFSHLLEVVVIRRKKFAGTDPDNWSFLVWCPYSSFVHGPMLNKDFWWPKRLQNFILFYQILFNSRLTLIRMTKDEKVLAVFKGLLL